MNGKKKVARVTDGKVDAVYESLSWAARLNGISKSGISKAMNGKAKTYKGYEWRSITDDEFEDWFKRETQGDTEKADIGLCRRFWLWLYRLFGWV